ncbi:hypothetical protein GJ744_009993 [Endocarpon pusillum]|uniref:G domain-containing protein n=1 Tax=Endocarpon pusillum TaxID=364733 RepID=A0A8H7AI42_9EURO|nr:hypothetical protein GJ744_009993 [Endocarpon pusillum]
MFNPELRAQDSSPDLPSGAIADHAIVAVMGTTGSGKSTFIQKATGSQDVVVGHTYAACTQVPQLYDFTLDGKNVALLDTPGFDDTYKTDSEVLQGVAEFLAFTYRKNMKLSGIIYLQRITDPRMTHGGRANLELFRALCGDDPLRKVTLATTFWGEMRNLHRAAEHEEELKSNPDYWGEMLAKKASMTQFHDTKDSAQNIIRDLLENEEKITLKIQEEMVDQKLGLIQTTAGETLKRELTEMAEQHEKQVQMLKQEIETALQMRDYELKEIKEQQARKSERARQTFQNQMDALKAHNREELRARDMEFDARLMTIRRQQETETLTARTALEEALSRPQTPIPNVEEALLPTSDPALGPTPNGQTDTEIQKEKSRHKREKYLSIFGAVGTTATAAGLSVINPLAIPVAFAGLVGIINACFTRREANDLERRPEVYQDIAAG